MKWLSPGSQFDRDVPIASIVAIGASVRRTNTDLENINGPLVTKGHALLYIFGVIESSIRSSLGARRYSLTTALGPAPIPNTFFAA